jgi:hypothetical protein
MKNRSIYPAKPTYREIERHAIAEAKRTGQNYFIYEDRDEYGPGKHWAFQSERMYREVEIIPESWVKAYVGPDGVIETY